MDGYKYTRYWQQYVNIREKPKTAKIKKSRSEVGTNRKSRPPESKKNNKKTKEETETDKKMWRKDNQPASCTTANAGVDLRAAASDDSYVGKSRRVSSGGAPPPKKPREEME